MKSLTRYILLLFLLLRLPQANAQQLDSLLQRIRAFNVVHTDGVGQANIITSQCRRYDTLLKITSTDDLLRLTDDSNAVVNCYAALGLIKREYADMVPLFAKLLRADKHVAIVHGCIRMSESRLWYDVYIHYLMKREEEAANARRHMDSCVTDNELEQYIRSRLSEDDVLLGMDSCILYSNNNIEDYMMWMPFNNRLYPASYLARIEYLALEKRSKNAIQYLEKHYGTQYDAQIKQALLAYIAKTAYKKHPYYYEVSDLLEYRDEEVNKAIIVLLNNDITWRSNYRSFKRLFSRYGLKERLPHK